MDTPTFTQEEVVKVFHITRLYLAGADHNSVSRNVDMTHEELDVLQRKIERWQDSQK